MGKYLLKLPKMGESVAEATLTAWLKNVGDSIAIDESIVEVATDKVDSDIPSEVEGVLLEKKFKVNEIAQVGDVIAVIEIDGPGEKVAPDVEEAITLVEPIAKVEIVEEDPITVIEAEVSSAKVIVDSPEIKTTESSRFYSPLVKNIAKEEDITLTELETVRGTGDKNRVTKKDILGYIAKRTTNPLGKSDGKVPDVTPIIASGQDKLLK